MKKVTVKFGRSTVDMAVEKCKWHCSMFKKGDGDKLILCTSCWKLVHKQCSGLLGSFSKPSVSFVTKLFSRLTNNG